MPALVFLGRRWQVGSDDFVVPNLINAFFRGLWVAALAITFKHASDTYSFCDDYTELKIYLLAGIALYSLVILLELLIVRTAMKGTIMNTRPRAAMKTLLSVRLASTLLEVAFAAFGGYLVFRDGSLACEDLSSDLTDVLHAVAISNWVLLGVEIILAFCLFDPMGMHADHKVRSEWRSSDAYRQAWAKRAECYFCCVKVPEALHAGQHGESPSGGHIWLELAHLITCFFRNLDVVPSDIAAGLVVMRERQKIEEKRRIAAKMASIASGNRLPAAELAPANLADNSNIQSSRSSSNGTSAAGGLSFAASNRKFSGTSPVPPNAASRASVQGGAPAPKRGSPYTRYYDQVTALSRPLRFIGEDGGVDAADLLEIDHFGKFALGIYGWPLYLFMHLCTGVCRLNVCNCACAPCHKPQFTQYDIPGTVPDTFRPASAKDVYVGDNCCSCNLAALKKQTGLHDCDIAYVSFSNELFQTPFYVAIDHSRRSVVITIRGTLSLEDAVVDLIAGEHRVTIPGTNFDCHVHKGMYQAAQGVKETLERSGVLKALMGRGAQCENYGLVVVGHSLGAGTATLLSLLLREEYPALFCYAYSPPGGLLSLELSKYAESFIISVVLGKDLVPRLGRRTAELLRDQMVHAVAATRKPKWSILSGTCCKICVGVCCCADKCCEDDDDGGSNECLSQGLGLDVEIDVGWPEDDQQQQQQPLVGAPSSASSTSSLYGSLMGSALSSSSSSSSSSSASLPVTASQPKSFQRQASSSSARGGYSKVQDESADSESAYLLNLYTQARRRDQLPMPLYMPGRVLHLVKTKSRPTHCGLSKERLYEARWASVKEFDRILVSPLMVADHLPDKVMQVLTQVTQDAVAGSGSAVSDV